MEFLLLGTLEVRDGDRSLSIGGPKRRALLALLALHANEVFGAECLADELWGEDAPRNAAASLHNHVSRLRKELGTDMLLTHHRGYELRTDRASVDALRFEDVVASAAALPPRERAARLAESLSWWRGDALADLAFEPSLSTHAARLTELRLVALEQRIDADLELGRAAELVPELGGLIQAQPLREHLRSQLILALYRSGRQADALEAYRETRRLLSDQLGIEPGPELRDLERAVLQQDPALDSRRAPNQDPPRRSPRDGVGSRSSSRSGSPASPPGSTRSRRRAAMRRRHMTPFRPHPRRCRPGPRFPTT